MNRTASQALFEDQIKHLEGATLDSRKWRVFSRAFPLLDVAFEHDGRIPMRVQMHCDDWNELPPSIILATIDGDPLKPLPTGPTGIFHQGPHPKTGRPFICMAGAREYHTHDSHLADLWDNYKNRSGYDLGGILHQIWSAWMKSTP